MVYHNRIVNRSDKPSPEKAEGNAPAEKEAANGNGLRKRKRHNSAGDKSDSTAAGSSNDTA